MRGEFIDLSGERVYYYAAGTRGAGEPVVLIHGFPASSHLWFDVVPKLPGGHRVIVVDLLGFGRSDAPPEATYTVAAHGARLVALLDALQIDHACVVGHQAGGAVAEWVARNRGKRVSRLGLIGSATVEGAFAGGRPLSLRGLSLLLRLPAWCWFPIVRGAIARRYDDAARGHRSGELYLRPFETRDGASILRRHIRHLTNGDIAELARRRDESAIPTLSSTTTHWPFLPEEAPSEVAASIAKLLLLRP